MPGHPLAFSLTLMVCAAAHAQVIPDTLDNRRYFPLAVGNEWQYVEADFNSAIPSYQRRRIVSDTLVHDRHYYMYVVEGYDKSFFLGGVWTTWIRYNDAGAVVTFIDIADDTLAVDSTLQWYHADFGDSVDVGHGRLAAVGGRYDTTGAFGVAVAAIKILYRPLDRAGTIFFQSEVQAADFGLIQYETFDGPIGGLSYARIDAREYGERVITVHREVEERAPTSTRIVSIFPNPATSTVTIGYRSPPGTAARLEVFDALGRIVHRQALGGDGVGSELSWDISEWPAGLYLVRWVDDTGHSAAASFVKRL
jgi:Secretion system C-terminal sorting domain